MFGMGLFAIDLSLYRDYVPFAIAFGVTSVVLTICLVVRSFRKPGAIRRPKLPSHYFGDVDNGSQSFGDRRTSIRREGAPVRVLITSITLKNEVLGAWVVDRSTGGLRLVVEHALDPNSVIQILTEDAPDTTPWVTLIVRGCRKHDNHYELGCEFESTPPWNVLLLFG